MVKGIFLAAGMSSRFGSQKLVYEIEGVPVVCRSLQNCINSNLRDIIVITGFEGDKVEDAIRSSFPGEKKIRIVHNKSYRDGMFSSFKKGLSIIEGKCKGVMMLLGDMPYVLPVTINRILGLWEEGSFVIPRVGGTLTHPRVIPSSMFEEFNSVPDNGKGLDIIKRYNDEVREVFFSDEDEFRDMDSLNP